MKCRKKILLIMPGLGVVLGGTHPPVGIGCLSEALEEHGMEHDVIDLRLDGKARLRALIAKTDYEYFGVTLYSFARRKTYALLEELRRRSPQSKIVVGGPHPSAVGKDVFRESSHIDYAFRGEAEDGLVELLRTGPQQGIDGLLSPSWPESKRASCGELDRHHFPRYRHFELERYAAIRNIVSSRGCPHPCTFCSVHTINGREYRERSVDSIMEEIAFWVAGGTTLFNFQDDNFCHNRQRILELCDRILREYGARLTFICIQGVRADSVDPEMLGAMKRCGFSLLSIGVDGSNDRTLELVRKRLTMGSVHQAIRMILAQGINLRLFFIIGFPGQVPADVEEAFSIALAYPLAGVEFYNAIPFVGTTMFTDIHRTGSFLVDPDEALERVNKRMRLPIFVTPEMGLEDRQRLMKQAAAVKRTVKRRFLDSRFPSWPFRNAINPLLSAEIFERLLFNNRLVRNMAHSLLKRP